ncbi:MAG: DUF502 domain-containing protein [Clostridiales bacterium]|nr:DUF502 domain-containing protein [Clostridiales bacterium]
MLKKIERWFLSGIAVVLPVAVTVFVLIWLFNLLDGILRDLINKIFKVDIPGLGLLVLILLIFLIGMFTSNFVGRKITGWFEKIIGKIPLIKTVYNPVRKIISGLSSEKTDSFQKVVMVEFPQKGRKSIGFITNSNFTLKGEEKISVFVPTTPNPTNGFLIIVDRKDVEILDMTVNEGLNTVVSIGSAIEGNIDIEKGKIK